MKTLTMSALLLAAGFSGAATAAQPEAASSGKAAVMVAYDDDPHPWIREYEPWVGIEEQELG
ncbi:hypothetical protein [Paracidovorax citrulli]